LSQYETPASDINDTTVEVQGKRIVVPKSPGYELMRNMLSESPLLRKIFWILSYGNKHLESEAPKKNGEYFEETVVLSLKMLETVFSKEEHFAQQLSLSTAPILVNRLDLLLLADKHTVMNIAKYINYRYNLTIPLYSVKIITYLGQKQVDKLINYKKGRIFIIVTRATN
jgi:hypothetical protein